MGLPPQKNTKLLENITRASQAMLGGPQKTSNSSWRAPTTRPCASSSALKPDYNGCWTVPNGGTVPTEAKGRASMPATSKGQPEAPVGSKSRPAPVHRTPSRKERRPFPSPPVHPLWGPTQKRAFSAVKCPRDSLQGIGHPQVTRSATCPCSNQPPSSRSRPLWPAPQVTSRV